MNLVKTIGSGVNRVLGPIGLKLERAGHDWSDVSSFIPFDETMANARTYQANGTSLGDYIDIRQGITGATQTTISQMAELGVFDGSIRSIVEIGPGTGRYLDYTLRQCSPERYEIYETASEWADFVAKKYAVVRQPTNGSSLQATATASIDLVQAHKVLSATTFLVTANYWCEMVRVVRAGGYAVFDVVTEHCLDPAVVEAWVNRGMPSRSTYPSLVPFATVVGFFCAHGFEHVGCFLVPMPPGHTEVFVFRKSS
jgi:hypothetical protein